MIIQQKKYNSISPEVSEEIRDFYERYPYPRQVDSLENYRQLWMDDQRRRADYHLFWPSKPYREDFSILVAGCGTSQAARYALRWPKATITGIDFSETSVHCTEDLGRKYNLKNLKVHKLSIEQVNDLGTNFDQIVCTGVLHHLPDPDTGLKALRNVLKPDGVMHLMLYAPYGRTGIYMLQDFCKRVGITATDEGIQELIAALRLLPHGHPLENLLREAPDFQYEASLADALLHPQDRAYSVPQFFDFIERGELTFGRWIRQAPYNIHCGVMSRIPQYGRMAKLSLAEQYTVAELFRGTMVRHSAVIYRNDYLDDTHRVDFTGDAWHSYIPIRMPDTICVQQKIPSGAAGVLINKAHTFSDLFMPLNEAEKGLYDTIDGVSDINNILQGVHLFTKEDEYLAKARDFFHRLWWYDQVVFDTSRTKGISYNGNDRKFSNQEKK